MGCSTSTTNFVKVFVEIDLCKFIRTHKQISEGREANRESTEHIDLFYRLLNIMKIFQKFILMVV